MKVAGRPETRPADSGRRPTRHRLVRRGLFALLAVAGFLLLLAGASVLPAMASRSHFEEGRNLLTAGQEALAAGDGAAAAGAFRRAGEAFREASDQPGMFLLRLDRHIPYLGRTPGALVSLADIGRRISAAGLRAATGLEGLPGGLSALGLQQGRIPLEALESLAPAVRDARRELELAAQEADRLPESWLLGPVAEARELVRDKLAQALPLARAGDAMLQSLPEFAGAGGPRRYFVAAENSAELRGTGGLIGNYAILTIREGRLSLGPFQDTQSLRSIPADQALSPSPGFDELYGPFGGGGFWLNINMTPDAPTAATLIESLYERTNGVRLDGTVFFDLQGLADLLETTGPVTVAELGATLTSDNVVRFVASASYLEAGIPDAFSRGPKLVAEAIWSRFLSGAEPKEALEALVGAASAGHLVLHAARPELQSAFRLAGVAGDLPPEGENALGVVLSNAAANKVDLFLHEDVRYEIALGPMGTARADARIRLRNEAPSGAAPSYPLGPHPGVEVDGRPLVAGENRSWTQVYCGAGCTLARAVQDGQPFPLERHEERGLGVFAGFVQVKPQETRELSLSLDQRAAWSGDVGGGTYRLLLHGQPLIEPVTVTVAIRTPPGMNITWTNPPMELEGGRATWTGTLGPRQVIEVRFRPPLPQRVWARIWDALSTPVVRLPDGRAAGVEVR